MDVADSAVLRDRRATHQKRVQGNTPVAGRFILLRGAVGHLRLAAASALGLLARRDHRRCRIAAEYRHFRRIAGVERHLKEPDIHFIPTLISPMNRLLRIGVVGVVQ